MSFSFVLFKCYKRRQQKVAMAQKGWVMAAQVLPFDLVRITQW